LNITYHNLNFTSFYLFNTSSPPSTSLALDVDCASSGSNALVASRVPGEQWPRFILDPKVAREKGIAPFFNLHGLNQKWIGSVKAWTTVRIHALGVIDHDEDGSAFPAELLTRSRPHKVPQEQDPAGRYEVISSYNIGFSVLRGGHTENTYLNLTDLTDFDPGWGKMVNMVEIFAEAPIVDEYGVTTGYEDWMFCIDDLVVEWLDPAAMEDLTEDGRRNETLRARFMEAHVTLGSDGTMQTSFYR